MDHDVCEEFPDPLEALKAVSGQEMIYVRERNLHALTHGLVAWITGERVQPDHAVGLSAYGRHLAPQEFLPAQVPPIAHHYDHRSAAEELGSVGLVELMEGEPDPRPS